MLAPRAHQLQRSTSCCISTHSPSSQLTLSPDIGNKRAPQHMENSLRRCNTGTAVRTVGCGQCEHSEFSSEQTLGCA
eukprot:2418037-Ditylum_brightwellii.AAC.1